MLYINNANKEKWVWRQILFPIGKCSHRNADTQRHIAQDSIHNVHWRHRGPQALSFSFSSVRSLCDMFIKAVGIPLLHSTATLSQCSHIISYTCSLRNANCCGTPLSHLLVEFHASTLFPLLCWLCRWHGVPLLDCQSCTAKLSNYSLNIPAESLLTL